MSLSNISYQIEEDLEWTIFLVDDDYDDLFLAKRVLQESPYINDVVCLNGRDALFRELSARHFFYDDPGNPPNCLIIIDIHMPDVTGIDLLSQIRSNPYTEKIPVMVLTGDPNTEHVEMTFSLMANGFIAKPLEDIHLPHIHKVFFNGRSW